MRLLKASAAMLVAILFISLSAFAQNAQVAPQKQAPEQSQPQATTRTGGQPSSTQDQPAAKTIFGLRNGQQPAQSFGDRLKSQDAFKVPPEVLLRGFQEAQQKQEDQLSTDKDSRRDDRRGSLDPGIYLSQLDGANVCGAIVSYNFSPGDHPQLESVTTCTPANAVASKRAKGLNELPQGPQIMKTVLREEEKK